MDAAARTGSVRVMEHDNVRIHLYTAPEDGLLVNTPIVEGPTRLVIFDGQFFVPHAREAAAYAERLGKPVDRIVLSHVHLDHWGGLSAITNRFPTAPVYAPRGVAEYLVANGQKIIEKRKPVFGDKIQDAPTIPNAVLPEGTEMIDGVRYEFMRFIDAESAVQLVTLMPDQKTMLGFDLLFAPDQHVFTVAPHFDNWIGILDGLNALPGYDCVLSGHGEPTDRSAISATVDYLRKGEAVHAATRRPEAYASAMKAAFPDRRHPEWIELSAELLYGVVDAYVTDQ